MLYNNLSSYLKMKYGGKVSKICIDGGFGCPNRDGTCGVGGCIYCGERGAGEHIDPSVSIREQAEAVLGRDKRSDHFIAYFQNFTNTYAPVARLREIYTQAMAPEEIVALSIGTRPDCLGPEVLQLLAELHKEKRLEGISDINDYSSREGMNITIDLKRDANPQIVLNQLYSFTQLQISYGIFLLNPH